MPCRWNGRRSSARGRAASRGAAAALSPCRPGNRAGATRAGAGRKRGSPTWLRSLKYPPMRTKPFILTLMVVAAGLALEASTVRIIQTNAAGDSVMLIDPATNTVVGEIKDIEVNHGAAAAPDGSRFYITNEAESTLDVVDAKTLKVTKKIPLTNHPNNVSISKDGRRVYAAIVAGAGAVDVIDTASMTRVKS